MEFRYITKDMLARTAKDRWRNAYYNVAEKRWYSSMHRGDASRIFVLLAAKGAKITCDEVAAIIGNTTWTELACDICLKDVNEAFILTKGISQELTGEEPEETYICFECIERLNTLKVHKNLLNERL
jgi:hypothetical protein